MLFWTNLGKHANFATMVPTWYNHSFPFLLFSPKASLDGDQVGRMNSRTKLKIHPRIKDKKN